MLKRQRVIIESIRDDRNRGASQLAVVALEGLIQAINAGARREPGRLHEQVLELVSALKKVRPSMLVIDNVMQIWEEQFEPIYRGHQAEMVQGAIDMTRSLIVKLTRASADSARHMAELVEPGEIIMTHSLSSTVKQVFSYLQPKGISAIITESRPLREGERLAEHLSALGIKTTFITDAQMGLWCQRATRIITGADCVLNDGSVVNKAGTLLLALAAREFDIPFFTCSESHKLVRRSADELQLEEMQATELGMQTATGVEPRNIYFDITPAKLITGWVTETGARFQW